LSCGYAPVVTLDNEEAKRSVQADDVGSAHAALDVLGTSALVLGRAEVEANLSVGR
jgi:hypothetical protein